MSERATDVYGAEYIWERGTFERTCFDRDGNKVAYVVDYKGMWQVVVFDELKEHPKFTHPKRAEAYAVERARSVAASRRIRLG